jgi:multiple sugar transport system permease protein
VLATPRCPRRSVPVAAGTRKRHKRIIQANRKIIYVVEAVNVCKVTEAPAQLASKPKEVFAAMTAPPIPLATRSGQIVRRKASLRSRWTGVSFIIPFGILFVLTVILPVAYAIYLSLFQDKIIGGNAFVGFANYAAVLSDGQFWSGLLRVFIFMLVQVPIMLALGLVMALALDSGRLRWTGFFRVLLFLPYAVPGVVTVLIWGFIYGPRFGLVGTINSSFGTGFEPLSPQWILTAIGNITVWQWVGYNMLIFYSALKTIPTELYEAAAIDGAGTFRTIRSVKLPALRGALVITTMFSFIGSIQMFNEPNLLRTIAPNAISSSYTPNLYAYNLAFIGGQYNYSATIAIVMGVLTAVAAYYFQVRGMRKEIR